MMPRLLVNVYSFLLLNALAALSFFFFFTCSVLGFAESFFIAALVVMLIMARANIRVNTLFIVLLFSFSVQKYIKVMN